MNALERAIHIAGDAKKTGRKIRRFINDCKSLEEASWRRCAAKTSFPNL